jgi:hypothetical protein
MTITLTLEELIEVVHLLFIFSAAFQHRVENSKCEYMEYSASVEKYDMHA